LSAGHELGSENHISDKISSEELDALGEIANISMSSGATVLSELINHQVNITNPRIMELSYQDLLEQLPEPHLAIKVEFTDGLTGSNLLVISNSDAAILAKMMMGEDPTTETEMLDEIQISAASEAMNQMIASGATAMSQVFEMPVNISPPELSILGEKEDTTEAQTEFIIIIFDMNVDNVLNSQLIQMIPIKTAKEQVSLLFEVTKVYSSPNTQDISGTPKDSERPFLSDTPDTSSLKPKPEIPDTTLSYTEEIDSGRGYRDLGNNQEDEKTGDSNIDLILDIPITVSVVLGKAQKSIEEIMSFQSGSIVELDRLVDESIDILVNGTLVAKGEVVVVHDNFGVRITNILNTKERIAQLKKGM
jgi:flagellar motor switch protein FliN/FliY